MKGTVIYDMLLVVGVIVLVFLVIYWGLQYGMDMLSSALLADPAVIQGSVASALGMACRSADYSFEVTPQKSFQFSLYLKPDSVNAVPPKGKIRDWTNVDRGGYTQFRGIGPSLVLTCSSTPITEKTFEFPGGAGKKIIISKTGNAINISAVGGKKPTSSEVK